MITQNVDGLRQSAGNTDVIELHGTMNSMVCLTCGFTCTRNIHSITEPAQCPECSSLLKPEIVLFGEAMPQAPLDRAFRIAEECDVCIVVGTSAIVAPACQIHEIASDNGAKMFEFNLEPTNFTFTADVKAFIEGPCEVTLPLLAELLEKGLANNNGTGGENSHTLLCT